MRNGLHVSGMYVQYDEVITRAILSQIRTKGAPEFAR